MTTMQTEQPQVKQAAADQRSNTRVLRDLINEVTLLFRQELDLAKAEMSEKASIYARNSAYVAVGGFIAYAGLLFLIAGGVVGLFIAFYHVLPWYHALWISAVIVGGFLAIVGWIFAGKGISTLKQTSLKPDQTVQSLQENKEWLRQKVKSTTAA